MSRRNLLPWLVMAFLVALAPALGRADDGVIRVVGQGAESQFPDGARFWLEAEGPNEINEARLFFKKVGDVGRSSYRELEFERGLTIKGETLLNAQGNSYFPPGTLVEYSFEIRDAAGHVTQTPPQQFLYLDNRFQWQTISEGLITVYYYGDFVEERARTVLEAAGQAMDLMVPVLGIAPTEPLRIVSYNNYRHMSAALPFRSQAVREQLQTQGMAFTDERVLLVHGFDATVKGTTSHEFTHLLVAEAAGQAVAQVPAWLNEGLAEYGNIDATDDYDNALNYGIYTRRIKPLWYLSEFSGDPDDIIIAYGEGRSAVRYMLARYGPEKMAELMRVMRDTLDIDRAMLQVYGFDQYGLDSQWRQTLGLDPLPPPAELERELRQFAATPTIAPTPLSTSTPAPATVEPTPASGPTPPPGCGAPRDGDVTPDVTALALLLLPLGLLGLRQRNRR